MFEIRCKTNDSLMQNLRDCVSRFSEGVIHRKMGTCGGLNLEVELKESL